MDLGSDKLGGQTANILVPFSMPASPSDEYAQRLKACESRATHYDQWHIRIANVRLWLAAATALAGRWSIRRHAFSSWWLSVPVLVFGAVAWYHSRVLRRRSGAQRAAKVYRQGLARIEDRWAGSGRGGERFDVPHHVYAADLDLFGKGSLFELLSTARTRMGEDTLAQWLLSPSPIEGIRQRHAAVSELRNQLDFREELAVLGPDSRIGVHPAALLKWAQAQNQLNQRWLRWVAPWLAVLAIGSAIVWGLWGIATPFLVVVLIEGLITYLLRKQFNEVIYSTEHAFENLDLLFALLARLEREPFMAPRLQALMQTLTSRHLEASQAIARLRTIVQFIEFRRNLILRVLDAPLMYSVQLALAAEAWRRAHGNAVPAWLAVTGEMEALVSLATYSYEHPADPFPEFVDRPASFQGEELGHPLIPAAKCVHNSVRISGEPRVLLVSGSNMSGKSTLLRTVGVNTVLAMAGAPIRARRLQLTPLQVGASIRINDSLHEGNSRFYAEITRLRQIYDLADRNPALLFLLDELLQGTNSKDRRMGAEGMVRAFLEHAAIGLISTHDLALTDIGGLEDRSLQNVHFQDELENGRMRFDFKLRDGVVTKSNGLELMRSIGLKV
jgi:MutS domain V/MutS domain III